MSTKSNNAKNFVKDVGTKKQLFVFIGSDTTNPTSESTRSQIDIWNRSDFSVRVGQNSVIPVVPNVKWIQNNVYYPWSSNTANVDNFYAYNNQSGYVYLCISDNIYNRSDRRGSSLSTVRPTHTTGVVTYSDGYTWKVLYKITSSIERFVSAKWIPVVSFDIFDSSSQATHLEIAQTFCDAGTGITGQCAIYAKKPLSTDDNDGTIEYVIGDLFTIANNITCSDCHYFMKDNDNFVSIFYESADTVPTTLLIEDQYTEVGRLVADQELSSASPYYHLYNINANDELEEGSIVSAFVDLSVFTDFIVQVANPEATITSNSGSGGRIRMTTYIDSLGNYLVNGLEILARGSGYKDITLSFGDDDLGGSIQPNNLPSAITVNLDTMDGLAFDPITVLNAQHVMIDARLEKQTIDAAGIGIPDVINFFGLVENPVGISGAASVISGSNLNKKRDVIFRTTTKIQTSSTNDILKPEVGEDYTVVTDKGTITDLSIGGIINTADELGITREVEIKNIIYTSAESIVGKTLSSISKSGCVVSSILESPSFIQYTGNILSTTKLSSTLNVSDTDSVIIRINMVKGM